MADVERLGRKPILLIGAKCMTGFGCVGYASTQAATGHAFSSGVLVYVAVCRSMGVVGWW
jgi:hypothetical protein